MKLILAIFLSLLPLQSFAFEIPNDKKLHIAAGALTYTSARVLGFNKLESFGLGILAGIAKEAWDKQHPQHVSDFSDAFATGIGAGLIYSIDIKF